MRSKERLEIIKQRINTIRLNTKIGSRRIADEENAVLLDHIEYNVNEIYKIVERERDLLELYKQLNIIYEKLYTMELSQLSLNSNYYEIEIIKLKQQIKELENE